MVYSASVPPDITESLPFTIAARKAAAQYEQNNRSADIAFGGLPFRLAISDQRPAQRETAPVRKQQFDASPAPGEQSLEQSYWLRSQVSFHRGAGIKFYEPGTEEETVYRYAESVGVNPWTAGELTLLKRTTEVINAGPVHVSTAVIGGVDNLVVAYDNKLRLVNADGTLGTEWTVGTATALTRPAVYGNTAWVGHSAGVYSVDLTTGTATSRYTSTTPVKVYWAKNRLFATSNNAIYELNPNNSPASALPTALFTHPLSDWVWTDVAEAPSAVLAAGYAGGQSAIFRFSVNESTGTALPELGSPIQVAEFPPGEMVHALSIYLGGLVAIGTSKGIRIGVVQPDGTMQYGPLTVETDKPVRSLAARDSFVYGGVEDAISGKSGAVRINLGEEITPLRFGWAWDAQTHVVGKVNSIAFCGTTDQLAIAVDQDGVYLQSATLYEQTGYLLTGRIRYGTAEPKSYRLARLRVRFPDGGGSLVLSTRRIGGGDVSALTYSPEVNPDEDVALQVGTPAEYISLRVDLQTSPAGTTSPVLESLSLKALPAPRRQRLMSYPVMCFDSEVDRFGNTVGAKNSGYGWQRLAALEEIEAAGDVITVQDFTNDETYQAQIERVEFARTKSPERNHTGFGGVANVILRKLS